jgi:hypothetical protein
MIGAGIASILSAHAPVSNRLVDTMIGVAGWAAQKKGRGKGGAARRGFSYSSA